MILHDWTLFFEGVGMKSCRSLVANPADRTAGKKLIEVGPRGIVANDA
jgi:hypothetical protein